MYSFTKSQRLLKSLEFKKVLDHFEVKVVRDGFVLFASQNTLPLASESPSSRLGVIVSKKVGNAVTRNKFKRVFRESFRVASADLNNLDVVLLGRKTQRHNDFSKVASEIRNELLKLNLKLEKKSKSTPQGAS